MRLFVKIGLLVSLLMVSIANASVATKLPVEHFFKNPTYAGLQLSPNGKYIALLSPVNDSRNIVVMETEGLKNMRAITGFDNRNVRSFFWANDKDIVFTFDSDGNEAFSIYRVDTSKKKPKVVQLVGSQVGASGIRSAATVHTLPDDPDHIIVQYNGRKVTAPDLYKVPLNSSWSDRRGKNTKMKIIAKNPGDVQSWLLDNNGEVRGAYSQNGLEATLHYKDAGEKDFRVLRKFNVEEEQMLPLAFDYDNKTIYVASNMGRDKQAIYKYDPVKDELGEMVFAHDEVDVTGLMMSRKKQKVIGVSYMFKYPEAVYFDKDTEKLMKGLQAAFKGKRVNITSQTDDEMLNIVMVNNDNDPGSYYLYDRKKRKMTYLVSPMDWLKPEDLVAMKPIEFKSRDGLTIHGYLTLPKGSEGKKVPLIVNPHGGPYGVRDMWGFNPEHQFFANRGYATVQVNFRGSGGYGLKFQQAGYGGKWGAEMQHDITDAVNYLVDEGIVDPEKVCIYGASYGGYATMAGLTFTPDMYACGINYVGVTDVGLLFESMPKHWEPQRKSLEYRIGDPEDEALMKRMSPLAHVDKIKAPLMIVQGAKDPRVVKQHATDLRDALEDIGIELSDDEWIMKNDEGHGFRKQENVLELYNKMDKFLDKHLGK